MSVAETKARWQDWPDTRGYFGPYGGRYVPETLMTPLLELEAAYLDAREDAGFARSLESLLRHYAGRPTPLTHAERLSESLGETWVRSYALWVLAFDAWTRQSLDVANELAKQSLELKHDFRDDLDFGPNVQRIGDYLKEEAKKLQQLQEEIREAAQSGQDLDTDGGPQRIAEALLDRVVVQRSRTLCKEIENFASASP